MSSDRVKYFMECVKAEQWVRALHTGFEMREHNHDEFYSLWGKLNDRVNRPHNYKTARQAHPKMWHAHELMGFIHRVYQDWES